MEHWGAVKRYRMVLDFVGVYLIYCHIPASTTSSGDASAPSMGSRRNTVTQIDERLVLWEHLINY